MAHFDGLDLGRKRLSHKDRLFKVLVGDFLLAITLNRSIQCAMATGTGESIRQKKGGGGLRRPGRGLI